MKAESIEQIREHLAKGGDVHGVNRWGHWQKVSYVDGKSQIVFTESGWCSFDHRDIDHWLLIPLEEKGLWNV